jgi:hypothetical protein
VIAARPLSDPVARAGLETSEKSQFPIIPFIRRWPLRLRDNFRFARQPEAIAITSYKPTYRYRSGSNADRINFWIADDSSRSRACELRYLLW